MDLISSSICTVATTVSFEDKKLTMTAKERRQDERARQSEQKNKETHENTKMENKTKKYLKFQVKTTLRHKEDKQRKECAELQETEMEYTQKHKNQEIKTFISETIAQDISMSVTKSCKQNKVEAIEFPMKNAKKRCKKCWDIPYPFKNMVFKRKEIKL